MDKVIERLAIGSGALGAVSGFVTALGGTGGGIYGAGIALGMWFSAAYLWAEAE